jgi:hypothetical protein
MLQFSNIQYFFKVSESDFDGIESSEDFAADSPVVKKKKAVR